MFKEIVDIRNLSEVIPITETSRLLPPAIYVHNAMFVLHIQKSFFGGKEVFVSYYIQVCTTETGIYTPDGDNNYRVVQYTGATIEKALDGLIRSLASINGLKDELLPFIYVCA